MGYNRYDRTLDNLSWSINQRRAVLYLFTPRYLPDQTVRSLVYDFDLDTANELNHVISESIDKFNTSIGGNANIDNLVKNSSISNKWIKPDPVGQRFSTRQFNSEWTFILIIDNAPNRGRVRSSPLSNRLVYSGFCFGEEPVIKRYGNLIFNENCSLLPTHVTQLNVRVSRAAADDYISIRPHMDADIVSPKFMQNSNINANRTQIISPSYLYAGWAKNDRYDVFNGEHDDDDLEYRDDIYDSTSGDLTYMSNNVPLQTIDNSPKHQLCQIVSGILSAKEDEYSDNFSSSSINKNVVFRDSTQTRTKFHNAISNRPSDMLIGIDLHSEIYLSDLLQQFPMLRDTTEVFDVEFNPGYSYDEDLSSNPINVWSSLVHSASPGILNNWGISDCAFRYCSYRDGIIGVNEESDIIHLEELCTFIQDTKKNTMYRWDRAFKELRTCVFDPIRENCGEFELFFNYKSAGECSVQLQLIDMYETPNNDYIINNGILNGFTTPLVSTETIKENNAEVLSTVVDVALDYDSI